MKKEEKYSKSMKDKGFIKVCIWIPADKAEDMKVIAYGYRNIMRAKLHEK